MKFIMRVIQDIRKGENIDLHITILLSIVLTVFNLLGIVPDDWLIPLNLSVLSLITLSILGNRYKLEAILNTTAGSLGTLLHDFPDTLSSDINRAKSVVIVGVDLNRDLKHYYARLIEKLSKGHSIKILLVDPDSPACEMAAMLHYEPMSLDEKRLSIHRGLRLCQEMKQKTGGDLEVRLANHVPLFGAFMLNPGTLDGVIYLKHYRFKSKDENKPTMVFHSSDGYWYEMFTSEVDSMWNHAKPWGVLTQSSSPPP